MTGDCSKPDDDTHVVDEEVSSGPESGDLSRPWSSAHTKRFDPPVSRNHDVLGHQGSQSGMEAALLLGDNFEGAISQMIVPFSHRLCHW